MSGPYVYGYARRTSSQARLASLVESLAEHCRQHELTLCGVFIERGAVVAVRSPAFVGLLDVLELPHTYGVVMPARSHLGPRRIAAERERQIGDTRARLIVVRSARPRRSEPPGSVDADRSARQTGGAA